MELFDYAERLARSTDPDTSHEAARAVLPNLGQLQQALYEAVREHPGRTMNELANLKGERDPRTFNRRASELEKAGAIRVERTRLCKVSGRRARTWRVCDAG